MISHSNEIIKKYKIACEKVFKKVSKIIHNENFNFKNILKVGEIYKFKIQFSLYKCLSFNTNNKKSSKSEK